MPEGSDQRSPASLAQMSPPEARSAGRRALSIDVDGVQGLTRRHEQAISLGAAEAKVATDLRKADSPDEFPRRRPYRHTTVADRSPGIARAPDVAVDVAAHSVRPAMDTVDHAVTEQTLIGELVVAADVEHVDVALAARPGIAGTLARAYHVELFIVGREQDPVRIGYLFLGDDNVD